MWLCSDLSLIEKLLQQLLSVSTSFTPRILQVVLKAGTSEQVQPVGHKWSQKHSVSPLQHFRQTGCHRRHMHGSSPHMKGYLSIIYSSFNTYSVKQPMFIPSSSSRSKMISSNHKTPTPQELSGPLPWSKSDELIWGTWGGPVFQDPEKVLYDLGVVRGRRNSKMWGSGWWIM